mmetsp:Transcript_53330/g.173416  ORF Transcript_53330/g.173416 Transcript_53330/m.173416 type:complete len:259 (-) Transcript_53330:332-1108(-)
MQPGSWRRLCSGGRSTGRSCPASGSRGGKRTCACSLAATTAARSSTAASASTCPRRPPPRRTSWSTWRQSWRPGATGADNIMDCHGYRVADNLNPAPMLALMKMAAQPYRDGLRTAMIVDAPRSFSLLWRVAAPLLSEKTRNKIRFVSKAEAVELIASQSGEKTSAIVDRVMSLNREAEGCRGSSFPSELRDDDEDAEEEEGRVILRSLSRKLTRDLSGVKSVVRESSLESRLGCCRRRRIVPPSSTSSHGSGKEHAN